MKCSISVSVITLFHPIVLEPVEAKGRDLDDLMKDCYEKMNRTLQLIHSIPFEDPKSK
jgi:hypothetical protein